MIGRRVLSAVRDAPWATPARLRAYVILWLVQQVPLAIGMYYAFARFSAAHGGKPVATDFIAFWSAARIALLHGGADAYDDALRVPLQLAAGALGPGDWQAFWYPPPFLLIITPLGYLSYTTAAFVFLGLGYVAAGVSLRTILPGPGALAALLLSPVMLLNSLIGQNGAYSCAVFAAGLAWIDTRPALAGAVLGLLVCKPQLGVLAPLLFLASRRWRALAGFVASAAGLILASTLAFGPACWLAFLSHSHEATAVLRDYAVHWTKIQSAFAAVRLLGGGLALAIMAQATLAAVVVVMLLGPHIAAWRTGGPPPARWPINGAADMAMLVTASLLVTPYMFDYDLTCLLVPIAYLLVTQARTGPRPWELSFIVMLYLLPAGARVLAATCSLPVMPPVLFGLLVLLARRRDTGSSSFLKKRTK